MYNYRRSLIDHMRAFVSECVHVDDGATVLIDDLYAAHRAWCKAPGQRDMHRITFVKLFRAVIDSVGHVVNVRVRSNGQTAHYYKGVALHETYQPTNQ